MATKVKSLFKNFLTAPSVADVQEAIELIYPLVLEFRKEKTKEDEFSLQKRRGQGRKRKHSDSVVKFEPDSDSFNEEDTSDNEDEYDEELEDEFSNEEDGI